MKKLISVILAFMATAICFAADFEVGGIAYTITSSSEKTVAVSSKSDDYIGSVEIPSSVSYNNTKYSVTSIGSWAFYSCTGLTSVTIPNSVTSIGDYAFNGCSGLTSVIIPNSVTSIGDYAFTACTGLTSVIIPNCVTSIGVRAFNIVNNIVYSGTATGSPWGARCVNGYVDGYLVYEDITKQVLKGCSSAAQGEINIPASVKSIGDYAFYSCTYLTSVTIGNSVTSIGDYAFEDCTGLTSVIIPNCVTSIGVRAFNKVNNIVYSGTATGSPWGARCVNGYVDGYLVYEDITKQVLKGCSSAAQGEINIPASVKSIGESAFSGCRGLNSITIPNSVTSIGNNAFYECSGLTSVKWNAKNGPSCNFGSQVEQFTFGDSVQTIPSEICRDIYKLTSVTIGNSVTSIGDRAFEGCTGLTSVIIPNSVTSIGVSAFYIVNNIVYSGTATGSPWGARCVNGYVDGYLVYEDITKQVLKGCSSAAQGEINIPASVKSIGDVAFANCTSLTSITIPNSVTSIGVCAFENCTGITSVTIPNRVTRIKVGAFNDCTNLTSVTIGNGVTSIGKEAFSGCTSLTSIIWNAKNGPSYNFGSQVEHFSFGDSVQVIPNNLCEGMIKLDSLIIPSSVNSIGDRAFYGCSGVQSLSISSGVKSIGEYAFSGLSDKNLKNLILPDGIETIGKYAFSDCSYLKNVTFGSALEEIGENAFANDDRLLYITCYAEEPPLITDSVFPNNDAYLQVPCESKDEYKVAKGWKLFTNISCIGAETTEPTTVVKITSGDNEVTITWPTSENASAYTVEVYSNGELFCTLVFGADGVLNSVIYANGQQRLPGIKGTPEMPQRATLTNGGMQFTITGLDYATNYTYKVVTTDSNGQEIASYSGSFSTNGATGIDDITTPLSENSASKKVFIKGHLYILRDGKTYTMQGAEVR